MALRENDGTVAANMGTLADVTATAPTTDVYRYPIPRGCSRVIVQAGAADRYSFDRRVWRGVELYAHGSVVNALELDVPPGAAYVWHTRNFAVDFLFDGARLVTRAADPGGAEWELYDEGGANVPTAIRSPSRRGRSRPGSASRSKF